MSFFTKTITMSSTDFRCLVNDMVDFWVDGVQNGSDISLWDSLSFYIEDILDIEKVDGMMIYVEKIGWQQIYNGKDFARLVKMEYGEDFENDMREENGLDK